MKGLSLNPPTWIRDDWCSPQRDIPDTDNDEVKGSFETRDSPNTKPLNGERIRVRKNGNSFYLIDITTN